MTTTNIVLAAAAALWLVVVLINLFRRTPKILVASTLVLAAGLVNAFGVRHGATASAAAVMPEQISTGSCALIEPGMAADVVRTKLGKPSEVRDDGRTRGPGAVTWVYRDSRCAVHLVDEKVELVE